MWEWEETAFDLTNNSTTEFRGLRGGSWSLTSNDLLSSSRIGSNPPLELNFVGFRVAAVPEPSGAVLAVVGLIGVHLRRRRGSASL